MAKRRRLTGTTGARGRHFGVLTDQPAAGIPILGRGLGVDGRDRLTIRDFARRRRCPLNTEPLPVSLNTAALLLPTGVTGWCRLRAFAFGRASRQCMSMTSLDASRNPPQRLARANFKGKPSQYRAAWLPQERYYSAPNRVKPRNRPSGPDTPPVPPMRHRHEITYVDFRYTIDFPRNVP